MKNKVLLQSTSFQRYRPLSPVKLTNFNDHPLLCLSGVNSQDVKNVLDYIYNGEVKMVEEEFEQFLKIAKRFKLEELTILIFKRKGVQR